MMTSLRSMLRVGAAVALIVGLAWVVAPAQATTITVTTMTDELNTDGDCSLREAIRAANADVTFLACLHLTFGRLLMIGQGQAVGTRGPPARFPVGHRIGLTITC